MSNPAEPEARTDRLLAMLQKALGHELPNQLLAIQGLARILEMEEGERLGAEAKDYLTRLSAAARRCHELVRTLADIVRASRNVLPAQPISLREAARQAVAEARQLSPTGSIEYHVGEADLGLRVPGASLRQVLVLLLRKAQAAVSPDQRLRIEIGSRQAPEGAEFWVADNGPGLTTEQLARLFEPFVGRPAGEPDTALGLFLVRHIVESWGGSLDVRSTPGAGTTFMVLLPQLYARDVSPPVTAPQPGD